MLVRKKNALRFFSHQVFCFNIVTLGKGSKYQAFYNLSGRITCMNYGHEKGHGNVLPDPEPPIWKGLGIRHCQNPETLGPVPDPRDTSFSINPLKWQK